MITPCMNKCQIDPVSNFCIGCKRTIEEISNWISMTDEQRKKIIEELGQR